MARRHFVSALAAAALLTLLAGGAAAALGQGRDTAAIPRSAQASTSSSKIDLSSPATLRRYLRSIGLNPAQVLVQRGTRNYAGPRCPGAGWNCTSVRAVVQVSAANIFECSPASAGTDPNANRCVVIQIAQDGGTNNARCVQEDRTQNLTVETCDVTQANDSGKNSAYVEQRIVVRSGTNQFASQDSRVHQVNASGENAVTVLQRIEQISNVKSSVVEQLQNAQQSNAVIQQADTGVQTSSVNQSFRQTANAPNGVSGRQTQQGDIANDIDQKSAGLSTSTNVQTELQEEFAPPSSGVAQYQFGPMDCCADQATNPADVLTLEQSATQRTTSGSLLQTEDIRGHCTTSGHCEAQAHVNQNGDPTSIECGTSTNVDNCNIGISCKNGECSTSNEPCLPVSPDSRARARRG